MNANSQFRRTPDTMDAPGLKRHHLASPELVAFWRQQRRDLEAFRETQRKALNAFRACSSPPAQSEFATEKLRCATPPQVTEVEASEATVMPLDAAYPHTDASATPSEPDETTPMVEHQIVGALPFDRSSIFEATRARPALPERDGRCVLEFLQWKAPTGTALQAASQQRIKVRWDHASDTWVSNALDELHRAGLLYAVSSVVAEDGVLTLHIGRDVKYARPCKDDLRRARALVTARFPQIKLSCRACDPGLSPMRTVQSIRWSRIWMPSAL